MTTKIIPLFIPHIGCPNDCIFCNQRKITGKEKIVEIEDIEMEIIASLKTISPNDQIEIAFFGGSFTAIDKNLQSDYLELANKYMDKDSRIKYIRISTRPDAITEEILDFLKKKRVDIIELGVQSLDEDVLRKANRGHDAACVYKASKLIKKYKFRLGLQLMIGLPEDNEGKSMFTAKEFVKIAPDFVRLYPVLVIRKTELENLYLSGSYSPVSIKSAALISARMFVLFSMNNINVIRIGLQASDNINLDSDVIAGPFHPAFGEIVFSEIFREYIEKIFLEKYSITKTIDIQSSNRDISKIIGNRRSNKEYFLDTYAIDFNVNSVIGIDKDHFIINGTPVIWNDIIEDLYDLYFNDGGTDVS